MKTALQVKNLAKSYSKSDKPILRGLSFSLAPGEVTGFIGANGSGKTTALKCALNILPFDSGEVCFFQEGPLSRTLLKRVGFLPEGPCFYDYLTAEELLLFYGRLSTSLKTSALKCRIQKSLKEWDIHHAKDQKIKTFSKGMLRKVGLALALISEPELLILDEPLAGLDPESHAHTGELLQEQAHRGVAIFFSSHLIKDVEHMCDQVVVLQNGQALFTGSVLSFLDKTQSAYEIIYRDKDKKHRVWIKNGAESQKELDRLRNKGFDILSIQRKNPQFFGLNQ